MKINEKVKVRETVPGDIIVMKDRLRKEDIDEIWASHNSTPEQSLTYSFLASTECYTIVLGDVPVAMFGIVPDTLIGEKACLWLLSTDLVDKMKKSFLVICRKYIDIFLSQYPILYNFVDFRYKKSLQWLQWCGAKISDPEPMGIEQMPFCKMTLRRA